MTGLGTMDSVSRRGVATGQPYSKVVCSVVYGVELSHPLFTPTYSTEYGVHLHASAMGHGHLSSRHLDADAATWKF